MLLTDANEIPIGDGWLYETKYDGFRCLLIWEKDAKTPTLKSRNDLELNQMFPEIVRFCEGIYEQVEKYLPLKLDGELVYLMNDFRSNFSVVQKRGRMHNAETIESHLTKFPCHYVVFDLLEWKGKSQTNSHLTTRKQLLKDLFDRVGMPTKVNVQDRRRIQAIEVYEDSEILWNEVKTYNGEGVIAKKSTSKWLEGTRSKSWLKIKNWKYVDVIVTKFDRSNQFFNGAVYFEADLVEVVSFKHGLKDEEMQALTTLFINNGALVSSGVWELPPSICVAVACIDFDGSKLREPRFHAFQHHVEPENCNWQHMLRQLYPIPDRVTVTHPDKPVFPASEITKDDYLFYLQMASPYMIPFLQNRLLTVIRYPHGVPGESFYQKHRPDSTPSFVSTHLFEDIDYILCNNLETLLWLGNQLAIELHIPFQPIHTEMPTEIVFDLDPPSVADFQLAVDAALKMKVIFDQFGLYSFVKTSGGKGIQLYIPIPIDSFTYEQTGIFTEFVCRFLVEHYPDYFTIERLKKNRGNRLYLDYVQHREGKTIIAPYSTRGNEKGCIATPLNWEEVGPSLSPDMFTIHTVIKRLVKIGDPFRNFREVGEKQDFQSVLDQLGGL